MTEFFLKTKCRTCSSKNIIPILSLGNQYVSDFYDSPEHEKDSIPLELVLCDPKKDGCGLLQLKHTTPRERLYRKYWYRSGINQTMKDALADITQKVESLIKLESDDIVVDIGSNDSTLLRTYKTPQLELVGFEPAKNLIEYSKIEKGTIINDFFNYESFKKKYEEKKAKVITAISMFYDLDDPNMFVKDIKNCLDNDGICVIQMNYLVSMLNLKAFDNIGHEHLEYYSLFSLENLLKRNGLESFDIELNELNGGSFRVYIKHVNVKINSFDGAEKRLVNARKIEEEMSLNSLEPYTDFANQINKLKEQTHNFISQEVDKGKNVYIYGASTRGNTLLQYYGLDHKLIEKAAERNPDKWGKYIVGTAIPIISETQAREENPDYFLVLPWAFIKEFQTREIEFLRKGGKFIVPLPEFKVISIDDIKEQN